MVLVELATPHPFRQLAPVAAGTRLYPITKACGSEGGDATLTNSTIPA